MRFDTFSAACEAQALRGGRLDADLFDVHAQHCSGAFSHTLSVRFDAWRLADNGQIDVGDGITGLAGESGCMF